MPGAVALKVSSSGNNNTADEPSGAPIVNRRAVDAGSKGVAEDSTLRARASNSLIGEASWLARAVGVTPFGVFRNKGSLRRRLRRPIPWLTAEGVR